MGGHDGKRTRGWGERGRGRGLPSSWGCPDRKTAGIVRAHTKSGSRSTSGESTAGSPSACEVVLGSLPAVSTRGVWRWPGLLKRPDLTREHGGRASSCHWPGFLRGEPHVRTAVRTAPRRFCGPRLRIHSKGPAAQRRLVARPPNRLAESPPTSGPPAIPPSFSCFGLLPTTSLSWEPRSAQGERPLKIRVLSREPTFDWGGPHRIRGHCVG